MKTLWFLAVLLIAVIQGQAQQRTRLMQLGYGVRQPTVQEQPAYQAEVQAASARAAAVETHTPAEWKRIYERQKIAIESARKQSAEEAEQKKKAEESEMDLKVRIFTVKQNGGYPSARAKQVADRLAEDELDKAIAAARKARDQVNTTTNSVAIKKP